MIGLEIELINILLILPVKLFLAFLGARYLHAAVLYTDGPFCVFKKLRSNKNLPFYCPTCLALYTTAVAVAIAMFDSTFIVSGTLAVAFIVAESTS